MLISTKKIKKKSNESKLNYFIKPIKKYISIFTRSFQGERNDFGTILRYFSLSVDFAALAPTLAFQKR